jgi:hypothetical protein
MEVRSASHFGRFTPWGKAPPVSIGWEAVWVPEPVWKLWRKVPAPAKNRTPIIQPKAQSLYWLTGKWVSVYQVAAVSRSFGTFQRRLKALCWTKQRRFGAETGFRYGRCLKKQFGVSVKLEWRVVPCDGFINGLGHWGKGVGWRFVMADGVHVV